MSAIPPVAPGGVAAPDVSHPVLVHFYRAVVGHMDVWRQRMDATTNWAAATTAAMVTFSFSTPASPHFVLLLAIGFNCTFLLMESRRYQIFDLWRRRFRVLNQYLVAPVLAGTETADAEGRREAFEEMAVELGRLIPRLKLSEAAGYRIRRNYGYIFAVNLVAWLLKLEVHPSPAGGAAELLGRASVGAIPASLNIAIVLSGMALGLGLALLAPSEQMLKWGDVPSPLQRLSSRTQRWTRGLVRRHPRDPADGVE
jgi:uncharacterized membrane protein